jgi:hypothetical protein
VVGQFSQLTLQSFVAALAGTELPYIDHLLHRRRAMWATVVALVCGVIGVVAIVVAVAIGHKFNHASSQTVVDPALAELWYDFAALQAAGMPGAAAQAGFVPAPEPANTGTASPPLASQPDTRCTRATWPVFDNECLWGNTADSETHERRRRRVVGRLKSPWCSGLHSNASAYFCRSRS